MLYEKTTAPSVIKKKCLKHFKICILEITMLLSVMLLFQGDIDVVQGNDVPRNKYQMSF